MISFNDLLVAGLFIFFLVAILRLCGVRRVSPLAFIIILFFLLLLGVAGWVYWEWRGMQENPAYRTEWRNGRLEDLNGNPLDPELFTGPERE